MRIISPTSPPTPQPGLASSAVTRLNQNPPLPGERSAGMLAIGCARARHLNLSVQVLSLIKALQNLLNILRIKFRFLNVACRAQKDVPPVTFLVSCPAPPSSSCDPSLKCQASSLLCTQHSSQLWLHIRVTGSS